MSLFLGKIHYWLYNKIIWAEQMEEDIVQWARAQSLPADEWMQEAIDQYGAPTGRKPLEDIIDTGNIHGWLQAKITSAELRQAYLITTVLETNPKLEDEIVNLFKRQGIEASKEYKEVVNTPEEAFNALNDFILEGMPCDRVNEVMQSDETKFIWKTTACLHKSYWDEVKGDVSIFYTLRDTWVKAFIESLSGAFHYIKSDNSINEITKN